MKQRGLWKYLLGTMACVLLFSQGVLAKDTWELQGSDWYFYVEPDEIEDPENYVRPLYNGWVQYDENTWYYLDDSKMMTGWIIDDGKFYYLNSDGTMAHDQWVGNFYVGEDGAALQGGTAPDGTKLSEYGSKMRSGKGIEELNEKTALYIEVLKEHPDAKVELTSPAQIVRETGNGKAFLTFKTMKLYDRTSGDLLYSGDGCFELNAVLEVQSGDSVTTMQPTGLMSQNYLYGQRIYISPAGLITYISQREKA